MIFIDTNYFLRFLLKDVNKQYKIAKQLFTDGALGKVKLAASEIVIFEIYWVLFSFYEKSKQEVVEILRDILKMEFIFIERRGVLEEAVEIFAGSNFDLEDSFNLAYAKGLEISKFKTFDKKLSKKFNNL